MKRASLSAVCRTYGKQFGASAAGETDARMKRRSEQLSDAAREIGAEISGASGLGRDENLLLALISCRADMYELVELGRQRRVELEARVADLEERGFLVDRGTWKQEASYAKGDLVTYGGSGWIAQADSVKARPGTSYHWRLSWKAGVRVKETGRDGIVTRDLSADEGEAE